MKITGTLVNYYFHCKRQCYFAGNRITLENNSELVKIGRSMHETKISENHSEIRIDQIRIDKIKGNYLIEYKKSNSDLNAAKWQVLHYLLVLKNKGIYKKGKIVCWEKLNKSETALELELTDELEYLLLKTYEEIDELIQKPLPPPFQKSSICKQCAYRDYCYL